MCRQGEISRKITFFLVRTAAGLETGGRPNQEKWGLERLTGLRAERERTDCDVETIRGVNQLRPRDRDAEVAEKGVDHAKHQR